MTRVLSYSYTEPTAGPTTINPTVTAAPTRGLSYAPTRVTGAPSYAPTTETYAPSQMPSVTNVPTQTGAPTGGTRRLRGVGVNGQE